MSLVDEGQVVGLFKLSMAIVFFPFVLGFKLLRLLFGQGKKQYDRRASENKSRPTPAANSTTGSKGGTSSMFPKCQHCDYPGNGKCAACNGTGKTGGVDAVAASLAGTSQDCRSCGGSGACRHCGGQGWVKEERVRQG
jgi:hypothetical protein